MPKSRTNPERKDKLNNFKNKEKQKLIMKQDVNLPQVKEIPVWASDAKIEVTGKEFELLYNFVTGVGDAFAAANSVMSRNILNGTIKIDFQKPVQTAEGVTFVPLTEEEAAPRKAEYNALIQEILNKQAETNEMPGEFIPVDDSGVQIINP